VFAEGQFRAIQEDEFNFRRFQRLDDIFAVDRILAAEWHGLCASSMLHSGLSL